MTTKLIDQSKVGAGFLSDEALALVAGGLNPQPLPPKEAFSIRSLFSVSVARFSVARFFFR